jgi:hypothetical protein
VLAPSTKAVDAALLLARCLTPEPMRPGWSDALRMSRSVLPHQRLTSIDQRLADAAARPVIVPGTNRDGTACLAPVSLVMTAPVSHGLRRIIPGNPAAATSPKCLWLTCL